MSRQQRIDELELQQGSSAEDPFLHLDKIAYARHQTATPGVNETYVAFLEHGYVGFHKPFAGISVPNALNYGHHPDEVPINECTAWRLAHRLGAPFSDIVPPTVLRAIDGSPGSLAAKQEGVPHSGEPFVQAQHQAFAAAAFDSLIAQQDRHAGNYRWDAGTQRLGLIDHGYAFALPGHRCNASAFVGWRLGLGHHALTPPEMDALDQLLASGDLLGLRPFMLPDRATRLEERASEMLGRGAILQLGEF
jgi:hypothetical protein